MSALIKCLIKFLVDIFTGPDGETVAIGRVYSVPLLLTGLAVPIWSVAQGHIPDFTSLGIYFTGLAASVWVMLTGTNRIDLAAPTTKDTPHGQ